MDTKKIKTISYIVNHAPKNSSIFYQDNLNAHDSRFILCTDDHNLSGKFPDIV